MKISLCSMQYLQKPIKYLLTLTCIFSTVSCSLIEPPFSKTTSPARASTKAHAKPNILALPGYSTTTGVEQGQNPYDAIKRPASVVAVKTADTEVNPATSSTDTDNNPVTASHAAVNPDSSADFSVNPVPSSPVVESLLTQAKIDMSVQRNSAAVEKLQRALRIESRNPDVWHQLAQVHFSEGKDVSAISIAKKSNIYVVEGSTLESLNWKLIKAASKRSGNIKSLKDAIRYERNHPE